MCEPHQRHRCMNCQLAEYFVVVCRSELLAVREGQPTVEEIVTVTLKECRKENIVYKMTALQCTAAILHAYDVDCMKDIADILLPLLPSQVCFTFLPH